MFRVEPGNLMNQRVVGSDAGLLLSVATGFGPVLGAIEDPRVVRNAFLKETCPMSGCVLCQIRESNCRPFL